MKKILFVVTSHDQLGDTGRKTGVWLEEFAAPYYRLSDAGYHIDIVSPKGGVVPIDPMSVEPDFQTEDTQRFFRDQSLQDALNNTQKLNGVGEQGYEAVFYPGGHGPLYDLVDDKDSIGLIESFHQNNKWIAAVCHGPGAFKNIKNPDGSPMVQGKMINSFSNAEEADLKSTDIIPFLTEDMLKENGGIYSKADKLWAAYVVEDWPFITGQNPASSILVANKLLEKLQ